MLEQLTDPFRELTDAVLEKVFRQQKRERAAEQRYLRLLDMHRQIVQDERYKLIAQDLEQVLGVQLTSLLAKARRCTCACGAAPQAERVSLLQEIISEPLQAVWADHHRPKLADEVPEA